MFSCFEAEADAELQALARDHVRAQLAGAVLPTPEAALDRWIAAALARGRLLGFSTARELLAYLDAGLLLQRLDFDLSPEWPWAADILRNRFMTPFEKSLALLDLAWVESTADD